MHCHQSYGFWKAFALYLNAVGLLCQLEVVNSLLGFIPCSITCAAFPSVSGRTLFLEAVCNVCCSRTKTLHTFLQPSQANPSQGSPSPDLTALQTRADPNSPAVNDAAQAAAFAGLAGGPVRRRGANRHAPLTPHQCCLTETAFVNSA